MSSSVLGVTQSLSCLVCHAAAAAAAATAVQLLCSCAADAAAVGAAKVTHLQVRINVNTAAVRMLLNNVARECTTCCRGCRQFTAIRLKEIFIQCRTGELLQTSRVLTVYMLIQVNDGLQADGGTSTVIPFGRRCHHTSPTRRNRYPGMICTW